MAKNEKNRNKPEIFYILCVFLFFGCTQNHEEQQKIRRWYTPSQVKQGKAVFETHCVICHGENAQGTKSWKTPRADGSYPPPPLDGSAHAWHHPLRVLKRTIDQGGIPLGGKMPGFKDKLKEEEKLALISYFQDYWDEAIYEDWLNRGGLD